jgi:predicted MFS family arabinose efflux permease
MNQQERHSVFSLAFLYATRMLGLFMVLPVFILYGDGYEGATPELLGFAMGAYGLSQALFQIPFGAMSDRVGRKPMIFLGLAIFALGSILAATSEHIYGVIAGRFLQGAGAIASVIMALLSDLTSDGSRTKAMAIIGMSIGLSFSLALVLGPIVAEGFGLSGIFWVTAMLALIAGVWLLIKVPSPTHLNRNRDAALFRDQLSAVLKDSQLMRLDIGIFALHMALTAIFIAVPLSLVSDAGLAKESHWWVYFLVLVLSFFAMVPFILIAEKRQKMKPVFCAAIALLVFSALAMIGLRHSALGFCLALFLFFMGFNLLEASLPSLVSKLCPAGGKGTAMGVYSTYQFLGAFCGGVAGGAVLANFGPSGVYILVSALSGLWLVIALSMQAPQHQSTMSLNFSNLMDDQITLLSRELISVRGVEDVVVVPQGAAYLKILPHELDERALEEVRLRFAT